MKIITEKELNCRDNDYIDHIEGEVWKTIEEYPNYIISNMGRVFSMKVNRLLKPYFCHLVIYHKYFKLKLKDKMGVVKDRFVHRIVALAFVENADNKPIVHHIDGNRVNNRADNLMFVTESEHKEIHKRMKELEKENRKGVSE